MSLTINNGRRVEVNLPDFLGTAGFVEQEGGASLSYVPNRRGALKEGDTRSIDGRNWRVMAINTSPYVKAMRVLTLIELRG